MSARAPDAKRTVSLAAAAAAVLAVSILALANVLAQSKPLTALAGVLSSLLFVALLLAVGNSQKVTTWRTI